MEMAAKNKQIANLTSEKASRGSKILNGKVTELEKQVAHSQATTKDWRDRLKPSWRKPEYQLWTTVTTEHMEKAIHAAETPSSRMVYDPELDGCSLTPIISLVYTHKDATWHYYELGSSNPRLPITKPGVGGMGPNPKGNWASDRQKIIVLD